MAAEPPADGMVPLLSVSAVVAHSDIHVADHMLIINNIGFQLIADFGILEDKDILEMVKHLGGCMVAAGHVNIGATQVRKLQGLCYWVCDQQKHGQGITQDDEDNDMVMAMIEKMHINKGQDTGNVLVTDLGKFNPDDIETHETAFINLLAQTFGAQGQNLKYIMCNVVIPAMFVDDAKRHMYQLPLTGEAYNTDNKSVYHLFSLTCLVGPGLNCIIQLRVGAEHFLHGHTITMANVSYRSISFLQE
jgi:hypothetical protein